MCHEVSKLDGIKENQRDNFKLEPYKALMHPRWKCNSCDGCHKNKLRAMSQAKEKRE